MQSVAVGDDRYGVYFYINEAVEVSVIDPPVILTDATLPFKEGKGGFIRKQKKQAVRFPLLLAD